MLAETLVTRRSPCYSASPSPSPSPSTVTYVCNFVYYFLGKQSLPMTLGQSEAKAGSSETSVPPQEIRMNSNQSDDGK